MASGYFFSFLELLAFFDLLFLALRLSEEELEALELEESFFLDTEESEEESLAFLVFFLGFWSSEEESEESESEIFAFFLDFLSDFLDLDFLFFLSDFLFLEAFLSSTDDSSESSYFRCLLFLSFFL